MSERTDYPAGTPCWVETLQPDPRAAARFYGQLFGWEFDEPEPMPEAAGGEYLAARIAGRLVAGIGQAPPVARGDLDYLHQCGHRRGGRRSSGRCRR